MAYNKLIPKDINHFSSSMIEEFLYAVDKEVYQPFFNSSTKITPKYDTVGKIVITNYCQLNCKFCSYRKDNNIKRFFISENRLKDLCNKAINLGVKEIIIEAGAMNSIYYKNYLILHYNVIANLPVKTYIDIGAKTLISSSEILNVNKNIFIDYSPRDIDFLSTLCSFDEQDKIISIINSYKTHNSYANLIIDLPGQDFSDLVKDIIFLKNSNIKGIKLSPFSPSSGTPFSIFGIACSLTTFKVISLLRLIKPDWDIFIDISINSLEYNDPMNKALKIGGNKRIILVD